MAGMERFGRQDGIRRRHASSEGLGEFGGRLEGTAGVHRRREELVEATAGGRRWIRPKIGDRRREPL
jgi:hypothetical protein